MAGLSSRHAGSSGRCGWPSREKKKSPCKQLTGYWINKAMWNFRCYECQCQFHIGDDLPSNHPTKGIEVWYAR